MQVTLGEIFLLFRRRKKWNQKEAARHFNTTVLVVRAWERNKSPGPRVDLRPALNEFCYIARRRLGLTIEQLAKELEVSRQTIMMRESGKRSTISTLKYFELKGFTFTK